MKDKLVLALDVETFEEAKELVDELKEYVGVFKVGNQLFTNVGPRIVEYINSVNSKVFLDLKYHDIPNTVKGATKAANNLGAFICNVHCSGGLEMMKAAEGGDTIVLGVTVLTSIDAKTLKSEGHVQEKLEDHVVHLALLAKKAGLNGVVASPHEIKLIREACGEEFVILTPGVRPTWAATGDQKRVMTPKEAVEAGANYIVVGRPITQAEDRVEAAKKILYEIN
jgi:orotidine-5'-phosphate decarboxylase